MYKKISELKKPILIYVKFALILSLAYFPLWSFIMSIKNDALTLSYPPFYFFCNQLAVGNIPWWHFNLHLGFPLHADPGFPFWSPITWLWGTLAGAGLYSYTLLIYSYIFISGIGMIRLAKWFGFGEPVQLMLGIAFSVSGFFSAHLQHPHYIFEAAFVPFVLLFFLKLLFQPDIRNSIYLAITVFFLVNSGYPSFTISAMYFFPILLGCILILPKRGPAQRLQIKKILPVLTLSILLSVLLCLPTIYSVYQFYPFFNRSTALGDNYISSGGMTLRSLLSILFPLASVSDPVFFGTDRAWSNIYIGILPLLFIIYGLRNASNSLKYPLIISGLFMLLASMQGNIKNLFSSILPFYNRMHSTGGLRIYFIVSALILSGMGAEHFFRYLKEKQFKITANVLIALFIITGVIAVLSARGVHMNWSTDAIKNLPAGTAILFQCVFGLIVTSALVLSIHSKKSILAIGFAEMIIAFLINIPFTGLGTHSTKYVQNHIDSLVKTTIAKHDNILLYDKNKISDPFIKDPVLFTDKIGITQPSTYPSGFTNYFSFVEKEGLEKLNLQQPVVSTKDFPQRTSPLEIKNFAIEGDQLSFTGISGYNNDTLVIFQNYYPNWKYYIDGSPEKPGIALGTFTAIKVNKGSFSVKGVYWPEEVVICFAISIFAWLGIFVVLVQKRKTVNVYRYN